MSTTINASTSSGLVQTADNSGTLVLQSNGTTQQTIDSTGSYGQLKSGTAIASTSGTSILFTGIPSWVKRITLMFQGVSTSGSSVVQVQIGSGSVTNTGYSGSSISFLATANSIGSNTTGFFLETSSGTITGSTVRNGIVTLALLTGNTWVASGTLAHTGTTSGGMTGGYLALSGALDRVNITTVNGTDTFDAGSINILYEG